MVFRPKARVVVVDDQATHNLLLGVILRRAGYEVTPCEDAALAIPAIAQGCDCVITDYQMPGMNGIELIQAARRRVRPVLPVFVVLTGSDGPGLRERALAAGADLVIHKPAEPPLILAVLDRLFSPEQRGHVPPRFPAKFDREAGGMDSRDFARQNRSRR